MKKFLFTAVFAMLVFVASAQSGGKSPVFFSSEKADRGVTFGIRAGFNFANASVEAGHMVYETSSRTAFHVGIVADIPIVKSLYVQPGFYLQSKGAKYEYIYSGDYAGSGYELTGSPLYLQIPILLSYRCDFSDAVQLQVNFGPYFAYGVGGKLKLERWDEDGSDTYSYNFFGDDLFVSDYDKKAPFKFNRFDCGLQIGAGFTFAKHYYVGFSYEFGLTNGIEISREYRSYTDMSLKNSNWMLGIGYNF